MDELYGCDQTRAVLAELAAGSAAGHERAAALRHVATCEACRAELAQLANVADSLLLLAPKVEPPAGFESRVVASLTTQLPARPVERRHRVWSGSRRRLTLAVASVVVAAVLGASVTWWATAADRTLAEQTRQTMAVANGKYLKAASLTTESGRTVGAIFMYQGNPSWLLVSVASAPTDGAYDLVLTNRDGLSYPIGVCQVSGGTGTTAYQLAMPLEEIATLAMSGPSSTRFVAQL